MPFLDYAARAERELVPGFVARLVHTDGVTVARVVPHSARALGPCRVLDVLRPARDDYR